MPQRKTRRDFLVSSVAMGFAALKAIAGTVAIGTGLQKNAATMTSPLATMPERLLGRTGVKVPILGLGGASAKTPLSNPAKESEAREIIQRALELGIRYFDTASSYGPSEDYLGKVLPSHRPQVFLASKTDKRDRDGAWRELENSLKRLNTDYLDLWQLHHVSYPLEIDTIFGKFGAIKALEEAMQQKIVRFVGITGHHDPEVIKEGLRRFQFHTTLIPVNAVEKHHSQPFFPVVLPLAQEQNVGVIAMKVPAYGKLFQSGGLKNIQPALEYSLSQPGVNCCIIAADDVKQLEQNVKAANSFHLLTTRQIAAIEQRTANIWQDSTFYRAWD